jgi:hypothetical protein
LANRYRLEVQSTDGTSLFDAIIPAAVALYRPPPVFAERVGTSPLRWRVRAEDLAGRVLAVSAWRPLTISAP